MGRSDSGFRWFALVLVLLTGAAVWFGVVLFEEFVTADMRWGLWTTSTVLFALSALLGRRRLGAWSPCLLAAPVAVLHGIAAALDFPLFWPFAPLWIASALAGWWTARYGGRSALAACTILLAALLGFGGWIVPRALSAALNDYTSEPSPEIRLTDLDGHPYPVGELEGRVVVLDFFATWCIPCRAELPRIQAVRDNLKSRDDIVILIVGDGDSGDSIDQVAAFAESSELDLPFVWDPDGATHDAFGFWNIPALAVIDRGGTVRLKRVGYNAAETGFEHELETLLLDLAEPDPSTPASR